MTDRDRAAWWSFVAMSAGDRSSRVELERGVSARARAAWQARTAVEEIVDAGGEAALRAIHELLDAAPETGGAAVAVGTGPLEDLLHQHGDELVDDLERSARRSPAFAECLGFVTLQRGTLSPETERRLERWRHG